jgi:hypothetical protein
MHREYVKTAIVGAWVLGVGAIAFSVNLTSIPGWFAIVGLAVLPPLFMPRLWSKPAQSMSESIQEALRR